MHVCVILPENLCNRSPGICALLIQEETPYPLPVSCLPGGLIELTQYHGVVITPCYGLIFLLSSTGSPTLPGSPSRLGVSYQDCLGTPLLEVHPPGDVRPELLVPADAQRLGQDNVGKDKGHIVVPDPPE